MRLGRYSRAATAAVTSFAAEQGADIDPDRVAVTAAGFFLRSIASITAIVGGDLRKAVVFHAIWTSNVKHITYSEDNLKYGSLATPPPNGLLRPISVLAISESLRMPYETVRRHVEKLRSEGLCVRNSSGGVRIDSEFLQASPERMAVVQANLASLVRFLTDLQRSGYNFALYNAIPTDRPPVRTDITPMPNGRAIMRVCSEFIMRFLDVIGYLNGDNLITSLVHVAIWVRNTEGSYAEAGASQAEPGEELRRPLTVRTLSREIGLPLETTRRHVANLQWRGALRRTDDEGLIVPRTVLALPQYREAISLLVKDVGRLVGNMHRSGLDLTAFGGIVT